MRHLIILASLSLIVNSVSAQMSSEFWITITSDSCRGNVEHFYFGNHINATYGIDTLNPTLKEREMPPGESCIDVVWRPTRSGVSWGVGLLTYDFREIPTNPNRLDTFALFFVSNINTNADVTIRWPKVDYLRQRCDSMFIKESTGQIPIINAFNIDSLVIPDATDRNITKLYIYKYGCKIIDDVNEENGIVPTAFSFKQNYPNPFNPSTQITYSLPKTTEVTLKVYDVLGREIAVLVNERKQAGEYKVTWNAESVPSGVYFYRIVAGEYTQTKKMVVVK